MADEPLTIAVINYNGRGVLEPTLEALQAITYRPVELLLVDDGSTDGSDAWARQMYPALRVIRLEPNVGRPSAARNCALREARSQYVLLLDHDVCLQPDAATRLMEAVRLRPGVVATAPRLVYADDPTRLYGDGTNLHYLCVSGFNARGLPIDDRPVREPFPSLAGGNVLFDREIALWLGGYDEGYQFGWGEDAELCLRCRIAGFEVLHVPQAVASHVERPRGLNRAEAQFYNRYRMLFTMYETRTLLMLTPALLLFEFCLLVFSVSRGMIAMHLRAIRRAMRDLRLMAGQRARVQAVRMIGDHDLLRADPLISTGTLAESRGVAMASALVEGMFNRYWWLISRRMVP